jgi:hypothetical protein
MTDPYKRSGNGQFAKVAKANAEQAKQIAADLSKQNGETIEKAVMYSFAKTTATALTTGGGLGSATTGAKATPAAIARSTGGVIGKKVGGKKGEALGKIIGGAIAGSLSAGLPGAIGGGIAAAVSLDGESKNSVGADLSKLTKQGQQPKPKGEGNMTSPALAEIDKQLQSIGKAAQNQASQVQSAVGKELDKAGLTEAADLTARTAGAFAVDGAITQGLTSGGINVAAKVAGGALGALPGAAMALGISGGGELGKRIGGKTGEVIGRTVGGSIAGGVAAAIATGGVGGFAGAAIGGATGLATSNPTSLGNIASDIGAGTQSTAKKLGDAAKRLNKPSK